MKAVTLIEFWIIVVFVNAVLLTLVKGLSSICLVLVSSIVNIVCLLMANVKLKLKP